MKKYIIINSQSTPSPEKTASQVSIYFDTFAQAQQELQARYEKCEKKENFNMAITTREL